MGVCHIARLNHTERLFKSRPSTKARFRPTETKDEDSRSDVRLVQESLHCFEIIMYDLRRLPFVCRPGLNFKRTFARII